MTVISGRLVGVRNEALAGDTVNDYARITDFHTGEVTSSWTNSAPGPGVPPVGYEGCHQGYPPAAR